MVHVLDLSQRGSGFSNGRVSFHSFKVSEKQTWSPRTQFSFCQPVLLVLWNCSALECVSRFLFEYECFRCKLITMQCE